MNIIRSFRKTLAIAINENGELIVKAPYFLSERKIYAFIEQKQEWIKFQRAKLNKKNELINTYDFKKFIYIDGKGYNWETIQNKDKRTTKSSFYTKKFYELIINRADNIAKNMGFKPLFKLCNSKCIWGSCNNKSEIKLNWKLLILPIELQKYVIIHELCHIIEMNHSKDFWKEVSSIDIYYKQHRKELKNYDFLLKTEILN